MKKQGLFRKLKQLYVDYGEIGAIIFALLIGIAIFISGYTLNSKFLEKPLTNKEIECYQHVAQQIYDQGYESMQEIPDGISVEIDNQKIIVSSTDKKIIGEVIADIQDGDLVFTTDLKKAKVIGDSICMGLGFVGIALCIYMALTHICKKVRIWQLRHESRKRNK